MAGSEAEERVRGKAEAMMRRRYPDGRVIHELVLQQGGVRIDLACVTPDRLVVAEIKSERDTLSRLDRQLRRAVAVADEIWVCVAEKHGQAAAKAWDYPSGKDHPERHDEALRDYRARCGAYLYIENPMGILSAANYHRPRHHYPDPRLRFDLLWAGEMKDALARHFGGAVFGSKMTRDYMTAQAVEFMTGQELRRAVCAQLRGRPFPRADAPVSETDVRAGDQAGQGDDRNDGQDHDGDHSNGRRQGQLI